MLPENPLRFTFSRRERLHIQSDFSEILNHGRKLSSPALFIFINNRKALGEGAGASLLPPSRMGLVTSRKVGNAPKRNQAKRRLREIFRLHKHMLKPGTDCIFIPRAPITGMTYQNLKSLVLENLRKASVIVE
jgi:ribonuclease P protein component